MTNLVKGVAFITGAGSGIGQYTAYALARQGVKQIAICDIKAESLDSTESELKQRCGDIDILKIQVDTSVEDSVNSAIDQTISKFGRIDISINNAGIGGANKPTHDSAFNDWEKVISVNLNGVWLCQRAEIRQMLKQDFLDPPPRGNRGVIVNTCSMYGLVASSPSTCATPYTASKHGVMGLTKADAVMYAPQGIRINAICPGYVRTPLLQQAEASGAMQGELAKVPFGRFAEMEEIADAIVFLSSSLSSFMTGSGLLVDGGFCAGCY